MNDRIQQRMPATRLVLAAALFTSLAALAGCVVVVGDQDSDSSSSSGYWSGDWGGSAPTDTDPHRARDVMAAFKADETLHDADIYVRAHGADITLLGHLSSAEQLQHAMEVARKVPGVGHVSSRITIGDDSDTD